MSLALNDPASKPERTPWHGPRRRLSIGTYLGLGIGALMAIAVGTVLAITSYANFRNTTELLEDKSRLLLGALRSAIEEHLDPVERKAEVVAALIEDRSRPFDRQRLIEAMATLLAGTPQIEALLFLAADGTQLAAVRGRGTVERLDGRWDERPTGRSAVAEARARASSEPYWASPVYAPEAGETLVNLRRPLRDERSFLGMVGVAVSIRDLSRRIAELETETGQNAFILHGRERVLAHRALEGDFPGLSAERPLPHVTEVGDPVLFNIWRPGWQERELIAGSGHHDQLAGVEYIFLYTPLEHYADEPWVVGSYFPAEQIGVQVIRMVRALVVGSVALVIAVVSAFLFGRLMRGPILDLAEAASAVRQLDLEAVPTLPRSRFRELDDAGRAFNAMTAALRAFALYVPSRLVTRLIARGDVLSLPSERREVTIMFTDIADFSGRTASYGAEATARFLNRHFDLIAPCVEAEGGVVDKFIGDAVMALWGAVEDQPDHALRAVRAAQAIAAAVVRDNAETASPVRLRIGLHSGSVVVGNIGSRQRMNYTVVGDAVNLAQRLEEIGKVLLPAASVAIIMSEATRARLPATLPTRPLGSSSIRGRSEPIALHALDV